MSRIVISYIPSLHQGYLNFFNEYPGDLMVLGSAYIKETPRMDRDIRAISPATIAKMIKSLGIMKSVDVLESIEALALTSSHEIVMPDEDVNRNFASYHLKSVAVNFVPVFLRWDGHTSAKAVPTPAHRKISTKDFDREFIQKSNQIAKKSPDWWRQIGAIIVKNAQPILFGYNRPLIAKDYTLGTFGDPRSNFDYGQHIELVKTIHAEAGLIAEAAKRGISLEGASIYISTFPCPACAKLITAAGIKKVYYEQGYSLLDAEDVLSLSGVEIVLVK